MGKTPFLLPLLAGLLLLPVAACKSRQTSEERMQARSSVEADTELYWYQRGSESTKAIWTNCRFAGGRTLLANAQGTGPLDFWFAAQAFDLLLDSVGSFWRKDLAAEAVAAYFDDFTSVHPDRRSNVYNDDILWWVIACTRAWRVTGDARYLKEARSLYDHLWLTQVDNALGGGMWWRSDERKTKNSCANFPAVIAALNLYAATADVKYLVQGTKLYRWATESLFDDETGTVYDHVTSGGTRIDWDFSYNTGTFIGASMRLFKATGTRSYYSNAIKAADHLTGELSPNGIMKKLGQGDLGAFNGIGARYLADLARRPECGRYREYLLQNARTAWTSRRLSDGLNGPDWSHTPEAGEKIETQTAVSAAMLYFATSRAFR